MTNDENAVSVPSTMGDLMALARKQPVQDMTEVTGSGDYLPYIKLMNALSSECTNGEFSPGIFVLVAGDTKIDLGKNFTCLILGARPKAMQFAPSIAAAYNQASELFKSIKAREPVQNSQCQYGVEYLLWLPDQQKFVTYFLAGKTGRNTAVNANTVFSTTMRAQFSAKFIETKLHKWWGSKCEDYPHEIEMPPMDDARSQVEAFANPPADPSSAVAEDASNEESSDRD